MLRTVAVQHVHPWSQAGVLDAAMVVESALNPQGNTGVRKGRDCTSW